MLSQPLKFLFLSGLGLSLFLGNSTAFAQVGGSGDVVVPTTPAGSSGTTSTTTTTTGTGSSTSTTTTNSSTAIDSGNRFFCQSYNGQYTVMYQPESQPGQYYAWATPRTLGGGWDTQKRCETIAQRLETYRPDGLVDLKTAVENRQNILCVTTEAVPYCRIVLTVPPEKDPYVVRNSVFQNLASADSGQQTFGVNTYTSGNDELSNLGRTIFGGGKKPSASSKDPINLKPFLDRADGGTGAKLRNGVSLGGQKSQPQTGYRLNPRKFR
ncbi:COP23 domain-containing protein [Mastigocladopsis repens]|uniref:COP23 domain-containing protein n=1 Tax=Mastigocladopsis repens TaxID=221287 RepID=UPI000303D27C|nr:COP23 domain-containing protein [Mastigocladopsis repens]